MVPEVLLVVELLGPVTRVTGSIPVSWISGKWFGLETLSTLVALILCFAWPSCPSDSRCPDVSHNILYYPLYSATTTFENRDGQQKLWSTSSFPFSPSVDNHVVPA